MYRSDGTTPAEQLVDAARAATVCDTAQRAQEAGLSRIVIATPEPERFTHLVGMEIDVDDVPRSFADRLRTILDRHPSDAVCYAGTGMPLMASTQWASLLKWISGAHDPIAITNNLYSTDLIATTAVQALSDLSADATDNSIGLYLRDSIGVDVETLPRSAATLLDIDTPAELRLLALAEKASAPSAEGRLMLGPALRAVLAAESEVLDLPRITTAVDSLTDQESQILVVGRVSSEVWQALETQTASRVRVIAEERGMRATGRSRPRTLLGFHLDAAGPEALVSALEELADAVFLGYPALAGPSGLECLARRPFRRRSGAVGNRAASPVPAIRAGGRTIARPDGPGRTRAGQRRPAGGDRYRLGTLGRRPCRPTFGWVPAYFASLTRFWAPHRLAFTIHSTNPHCSGF